ncbi:MAG: hypothetical protein AB7T49_14590 [Oligoflexales bacterium]
MSKRSISRYSLLAITFAVHSIFGCSQNEHKPSNSGVEINTDDSSVSETEEISSHDKISLDEFKALIGRGTWESKKCFLYDGEKGLYQRRIYEFKDNKKYWTGTLFSDPNCQTTIIRSHIWEETYALGRFADYLNVPKAFEIDTVLISIKMVLHTQEQVDEFNAQSSFGYSDWVLGQPKDISGRKMLPSTPAGVSAAGTIGFDVIAIVDGYMTFGNWKSGDGSSAVTRPKELLTDVVYTEK